MNGLWLLMLTDLRVMMELQGEADWVAARLIILSPLVGVQVESGWVSVPIETRGD